MQFPVVVSDILGWLAFEFTKVQPFIPTYTHLLVSAVLPIYAGAHSSLSRPSSAAKPAKSKKGGEKDEEDEVSHMEGLSPIDALMFPLMAGATLGGLYFLIKWLQDPAILNKILNWYFAGFSFLSVSRLVSDFLDFIHSLAFPHNYIDQGVLFRVDPDTRHALAVGSTQSTQRKTPLPGFLSRLPLPARVTNFLWFLHVIPTRKLLTIKAFVRHIFGVHVALGIHGIEGTVIGLTSVLYYNFVSKPWWLTNLMGFGFAYGTLQVLSPTTFGTGTLILGGLFFYDIYFVFYTPMMVTVAKSLDVPIKMLFPRPPEPGADPASKAMSMLGLGDIVLPGIMIGLALRFDLYMFYLKKQTKTKSPTKASVGSQAESNRKTNTSIVGNDGQTDSVATTVESEETIVKAPYQPVAEGWGDRFWTFSLGFRKQIDFTPRGVFPRTYFNAACVGYVAGMLATLVAMQLSNHPQPALLYLVPGVLSCLWLTGAFRGEVKEMWQFSDAAEEEDEAKEKNKDAKAEEKEKPDPVSWWHQLSSMSSIFSTTRAEERSKRLEQRTSSEESQSNKKDNVVEEKKAKSENNQEIQGDDGSLEAEHRAGTIMSFSIIAGEVEAPKAKATSLADAQEDQAPDVTTDSSNGISSTGKKPAPRWNAGQGENKNEEHAGKRQRVD